MSAAQIRRVLVAAVAAATPLFGVVYVTAAQASNGGPAVSGPVTGGNGAIVLQTTAFDLSTVGYTQSEFFLSGTATSFAPAAPLGADGRWSVAAASTAPYTTRMVVYRPANPARFNGSVVVEWLNVSAGLDVAPDWVVSHNELIRDGFAWVGVSAQAVGVNADKAADPVRYAPLSHPGDSYSYDIYSQAGRAVRARPGTVLGGLRPRAVLAEGESQSAFRLTTYANAVQPLHRVYDGFLIFSRGGDSAPLSQVPQADVPTPPVVHVRTDLGVPLLTVQTETDLMVLGYLPARQPDTPGFRLWELAGTAHADNYLAVSGASDIGDGAAGPRELTAMLNPPSGTPGFSCAQPINTGHLHYVLNGAQFALHHWVTTGEAPAKASRLEVTTTGSSASFVLDRNGNVQGGVRTPSVDAPVAALSGLGQSGSSFCFLFGTTAPFDAAKLASLYPTHKRFVVRWTAATFAGVTAGFIRPADAVELVRAAASAPVPSA